MSSLTIAQQQVLALLAQGSTVSAAAQQIGVHRNTVANWRRSSPDFRDTWASVQYEQAQYWRDEVQSLGALAVETLRSVLTDEKASPSIRLRAALAVLDKIAKPAPAQPEFALDQDGPMTAGQAYATGLGKEPAQEANRETFAENPDIAPAHCANPENRAQACTTAAHPAAATSNAEDAGLAPAHCAHPENPAQTCTIAHPAAGPRCHAAEPIQTPNLAQSCTTVPNPKLASAPEPGRNAPCPCGSGRKYKHCCLGKPRPNPARLGNSMAKAA